MAIVDIDQLVAALNLGDDTSNLVELELYLDAAEEHVASRFGTLPSATYTETVTVYDDGSSTDRYRLVLSHHPVLSITSVDDGNGTTYSADFTVAADGYSASHDDVTSGEWTVTYVAGYAAVPADLKLAVLEDIRGLYGSGQIGGAGGFGGVPATDDGPAFRPVTLWPRVDAWIASRTLPALA